MPSACRPHGEKEKKSDSGTQGNQQRIDKIDPRGPPPHPWTVRPMTPIGYLVFSTVK
jgi:hypothetical protein